MQITNSIQHTIIRAIAKKCHPEKDNISLFENDLTRDI